MQDFAYCHRHAFTSSGFADGHFACGTLTKDHVFLIYQTPEGWNIRSKYDKVKIGLIWNSACVEMTVKANKPAFYLFKEGCVKKQVMSFGFINTPPGKTTITGHTMHMIPIISPLTETAIYDSFFLAFCPASIDKRQNSASDIITFTYRKPKASSGPSFRSETVRGSFGKPYSYASDINKGCSLI